jgi:hypothetical protein
MQSLRKGLPRELEHRLKRGQTELAAFASEAAAVAAAVELSSDLQEEPGSEKPWPVIR